MRESKELVRVLDQLRDDHRNMRKVLQILEREIKSYGEGAAIDIDLVREVLDYAQHYPMMIHHPREDLLFSQLLKKDPGLAGIVGEMGREHIELNERTHRVSAALDDVAQGQEVPRQWLESLLQEYIEMTRTHMMVEEVRIFPLVSDSLSDSDLAQLDSLLNAVPDPIFCGRVEKYYARLLGRITEASM